MEKSEFNEKFEWLAQDIWNPEFNDIKGKYALYLLNDFENRYEDVNNLVDDMNKMYPDIAKETDLPEELVYSTKKVSKVEKVEKMKDGYHIELKNWPKVFLDKKYWIKPKEWDEIVLYLEGMYPKRLDINWKTVYARLEKTEKKQILLAIQMNLRNELKNYSNNLEKANSLYDILPKFFKDRFDKTFDVKIWELDKLPVEERLDKLDSMLYWLEIYKEATYIANNLGSVEEIDELRNKDNETISKKLPLLDTSRWNNFRYIFDLARAYKKSMEK
jgi:hypothetical protein